MAETTTNAKEKWNIPPPEQRGGVSAHERDLVRGMNVNAIWVARTSEPREKQVIDLFHETCRQMDIIPPPNLLIYSHRIPNAFNNPITGELAFSTDLLDILPPNQLKAVMGHELGHYMQRKQDQAFLAGNLAASSGTWLISDVALNAFIKHPNPVVAAAELLGTFVASDLEFRLVHLAYMRGQEYRSDTVGANVAGPKAMADALQTLEKRFIEIIEEHKAKGGKTKLPPPPFLSTHPSYAKRIKKIESKASHTENNTKTAKEEAAAMMPDPQNAYYDRIIDAQKGTVPDSINMDIAPKELAQTKEMTPTKTDRS